MTCKNNSYNAMDLGLLGPIPNTSWEAMQGRFFCPLTIKTKVKAKK